MNVPRVDFSATVSLLHMYQINGKRLREICALFFNEDPLISLPSCKATLDTLDKSSHFSPRFIISFNYHVAASLLTN
ncbi:hypothetical protein M5689_012967 [Euphorbia peplus]|nr:hypothetical protein M5689_012967 [Euphorbia peplus]